MRLRALSTPCFCCCRPCCWRCWPWRGSQPGTWDKALPTTWPRATLSAWKKFADLVAEAADKAGGASALVEQRLNMQDLLDEHAQRMGLPPRRRGPTQSGGPPPGGGEGFGPRVSVVDLNGQALLGRPAPKEGVPVIDRPIRVRGDVVALARLALVARVPDAVESRFLRNQYLGILGVAATLMLLVVVSAWWFARRWARPLLAVQDATARIARRETDVRLVGHHHGQGRGDEIGDLVHNVNLMAAGLQRLEGARRRWVADISHELRTPLAVLRREIEALVDGVRPLHHQAMLSLQEAVLRIGALVDDLHLLAMSDLQALPCQFTKLDALPFVQHLAQRFCAVAVGLFAARRLRRQPRCQRPHRAAAHQNRAADPADLGRDAARDGRHRRLSRRAAVQPIAHFDVDCAGR
jgi:two-component system, OmpR family, sensor histidine kinase BaeS